MSDKIEILQIFDNPNPDRDYVITHHATEFTSVCPVTGHPDFGEITLEYIADKTCVELKSFKLYLQSYRNDGIYYESVTNKILDDLVTKTQPRYMKVFAKFSLRGGIYSTIEAEYVSEEFQSHSGGCCC